MIKPPEHLKHMDDLDLIDLLDHQRQILDTCIDRACHMQELMKVDGLYFAGLHYMQSVAELERRYEKVKNAKK